MNYIGKCIQNDYKTPAKKFDQKLSTPSPSLGFVQGMKYYEWERNILTIRSMLKVITHFLSRTEFMKRINVMLILKKRMFILKRKISSK